MTTDQILRQRYHGLYLSRKCENIVELSRQLMGLHCWFHRNVAFSALIRGASISGWRYALTKTWIHHALHGVAYDELPALLALQGSNDWLNSMYDEHRLGDVAEEVIACMEDGVNSRAEMRKIFAHKYDPDFIGGIFSSWGGIFRNLAAQGRVAFRDMTSRDFDLISAEPTQTAEEALPGLLRRYFKVYGPATLDDAMWFFGIWRDEVKEALKAIPLDEYMQFKLGRKTFYHCGEPAGMGDIPEINLLSGFDPAIVSYVDRSAILPKEYKKRVVNRAGVCLPSIAVDGRIVGLWNIKKGEPVVELFEDMPKRLADKAWELADEMCRKTAGQL